MGGNRHENLSDSCRCGFFSVLQQCLCASGVESQVGEISAHIVRYRPLGISGNLDARLTFSAVHFGNGWRHTENFGMSYVTVESGSWGSFVFRQNPPPPTQLRLLVHQPSVASLTANTPQIRLRGQVRNFDGILGCTVLFDAVVGRLL
jgi:hypothetical protein